MNYLIQVLVLRWGEGHMKHGKKALWVQKPHQHRPEAQGHSQVCRNIS